MLKRRDFLKAGAAGAALATMPGIVARVGAQAQTSAPYASGWHFDSTLVTRGRYDNDPREQVYTQTLMRVDTKALRGAPLAAWYLWFWTHDAPIGRLYVGPTPRGPFTPHNGSDGLLTFPQYTVAGASCNPSPPPRQGWDYQTSEWRVMDRCHFAAADVVWDPRETCFYATPHALARGNTPEGTWTGNLWQNSFVMRSYDGIAWDWFTPSPDWRQRYPMIALGRNERANPATGSDLDDQWDAYQIAYGRFLRDLEGNLVRLGDDVVWFYRGTRKLTLSSGTTATEEHGIGAARSSNFADWRKVQPADRPLFYPSVTRGLCGIGSALAVGGEIYLVINVEEGIDPTRLEAFPSYLKRPSSFGDVSSWSDGPGTEIYRDPDSSTTSGPGYYVVDPVDGAHYMAHDGWTGTYETSTSRMRVTLTASSG
jgi:hypothetical protein